MTIYEMCKKYYPALWDDKRIAALKAAGKITEKEFDSIVKQK